MNYHRFHTMNYNNVGMVGETLVANFFADHFSKIFSFPNPKTKSNAEVADVLVWMNRTVFLIEVKTRNEGDASIESWAKSRIQNSLEQIKKNYGRIKSKEQIFLHNSYYQTPLDCEGISQIIGLIVLIHDEDITLLPSQTIKDIYNQEIPIHVFSGKTLFQMTEEIDTVPDFCYYLNDRFKYLKVSDIPLNRELDALGYYKTQSNKFPNVSINFDSKSFWQIYKASMADQIEDRNFHNQHSWWLDAIEDVFKNQRKLLDGYPLGLYFAWEIGSMSRRERAYLGEKLDRMQDAFIGGKQFRRFAQFNRSTGNWLVFYFSKLNEKELHDELMRLVNLKRVSEVHWNSVDYGVYGFGFQVSTTFPPHLQGLTYATVVGADEIKGRYSEVDIENARQIWSPPWDYSMKAIEESPR